MMTTTGSKSVRDRIAKKVLDAPKSGIRDFFDIVSTRKDIISLGIGEPDFDTPMHIRTAAIRGLEQGGGSTSYTSNVGLLGLRQEISKYLDTTYNVSYEPESEILVTVGVSEAMDLAIRAIVEPGDEIMYHEPAFVSYSPVIAFAGGVPVPVQTKAAEGFQLTRAALEEKVTDRTKALILNYPNNPTGATLDVAGLQAIADFAIEHDLLVITDEIYSELTYDGQHTSIASCEGMKDRTVYLHGFSKAWAMTGFRMGYACAPRELTDAMMKIHQYTMMSAPTLSQIACIEALSQLGNDVEEMRSAYRMRRNFMHSSFEEMGLSCVKPGGAFYAFPYVGDFGLSSHDFAMRFLDEESVAAVPGTGFGPSGEGFLRCAYAASMDDLKEAMVRLARFVGNLRE